jgi:hypothetical protein
MEFTTEFLQITCLKASIYRLQKTSWVWHKFPRWRPDEQLCNQLSKSAWYSFMNWAASKQCCSSVRTVVLMLHTISILRLEHPDHRDWCPDGWTSSTRLALSRIASGRLQLSFHICVLERIHFPCRTLKGVHPCCWDIRTDATWNSSKVLDTEEGPDGKFSSSGQMMLGQLSVQMKYHVVRTDAKDPISLTWNLCRIF